MKVAASDIFALTLALAMHVLAGALLWFGLPRITPPPAPSVVPVHAVFLDQSRSALATMQREEEQRRALAEQQRQAELEKQRQAQEQARLKAEAEARRMAEAEAKRQAEEAARLRQAEEARRQEAERARQAEEARRKEAQRQKAEALAKEKAAEAARRKAAEEKARQEAEAAKRRRQEESERLFKEALAAEEQALEARRQAQRQAQADAAARGEYQVQLFRHIQRNWVRPAGTEQDFSCQIRIQQLPGGQIQSYELLESCGNSFLDGSVESAIRKSDPLPLPSNPRVFDRTLTLTFKP